MQFTLTVPTEVQTTGQSDVSSKTGTQWESCKTPQRLKQQQQIHIAEVAMVINKHATQFSKGNRSHKLCIYGR